MVCKTMHCKESIDIMLKEELWYKQKKISRKTFNQKQKLILFTIEITVPTKCGFKMITQIKNLGWINIYFLLLQRLHANSSQIFLKNNR